MRDSDLIRALNLYLRHGPMHATRQSTPDTPVIKQDLRMMLRKLYVDEENSADHSEKKLSSPLFFFGFHMRHYTLEYARVDSVSTQTRTPS